MARTAIAVLLSVLGAGVLWHLAYTGFGVGRGTLDDFTSDWVFNVTLFVGVLALVVHVTRKEANRLVPLLLGAAVTVWVAANVYWTIAFKHVEEAPYPSLADVGWLLSYVPAYIALVLICRRRIVSFLPSVWLDGLVAMLVVSALASGFVIEPIAGAAGGSFEAVATNLAYPIGDLLLVLFVVGAIALSGWRADRQLLLLGIGFVMFAVADTGYLYRVATDSYEVGTILDSGWILAMAVILLAGLAPDGPPRAFRYEGWSVLVAPSAFAMAAAAVLVFGGLQPLPRVALGLAAAALLAAFIRAGLTFREIRALAEVRHEALTDILTGLPNRRWFYRELGDVVDGEGERAGSVALAMIDLDGFKEVNDTLGHQAGDVVLELVARRLESALEGFGTLARLGGDEFAFLVREDLAENSARRIADALTTGFSVDGFTLSIGASVGIAIYPTHASDADSLLRRADIAMYEAKRKRIPYAHYSPDDDRFSRERLSLMSELRDAIGAGNLTLVYQPMIALPTGEVTGVEALARWNHAERGDILPNEFIPLAEHAGLMRELTQSVLRQALRQCAAWRAAGLELPVSVNVSAMDLRDEGFVGALEQLLADEGVPKRLLSLEITERGLMADPDWAIDVSRRLSALGVRLSLDDFGTGSSSLAYLGRLPVDEVKIDRSFVRGMTEAGSEIVRYAAQLGRALGLDVVAEGVEDGSILERLVEYECNAAQGFYFSRPLPAAEFERWLRRRRPRLVLPQQRVVGL